MNKLTISPDRNGYSIQSPQHFIAHQTMGGNTRIRCDIDEQSFTLTLIWTVVQSDFNTIATFFSINGATQFLIDLLLLDTDVAEYTAILIPDTFRLISQTGNMYVIQATIEVLPNITDISCQIAFIGVQTDLGIQEAANTINLLNTFVNQLVL